MSALEDLKKSLKMKLGNPPEPFDLKKEFSDGMGLKLRVGPSYIDGRPYLDIDSEDGSWTLFSAYSDTPDDLRKLAAWLLDAANFVERSMPEYARVRKEFFELEELLEGDDEGEL